MSTTRFGRVAGGPAGVMLDFSPEVSAGEQAAASSAAAEVHRMPHEAGRAATTTVSWAMGSGAGPKWL